MPESPSLSSPNPFAFTPVPVARRHNGWTPARQTGFIAALAKIGCVTAAARHVGMTPKSAYRLRERADAAEFAAAWDKALGEGRNRARDTAIDRALTGEVIPIFYGGRQVGQQRRFNDALLIAVLRRHTTELFGPGSSLAANNWSEFHEDVPWLS